MKKAIVVPPIYKKKDKTLIKNYCPISLFLFLVKYLKGQSTIPCLSIF